MKHDEIKAAEARGYAKGYRAGRRRAGRDASAERREREREAFRRRAFLAALPACIEAQGWKMGDLPVNTLDSRVELACRFANEAVRKLY